jgi:large subunit ribosomal protein L35
MPKMKTHRGAAKRLRRTGGGSLRRNKKAYAHHLQAKKSSRRKRDLRRPEIISDADAKRMEKLLPYK